MNPKEAAVELLSVSLNFARDDERGYMDDLLRKQVRDFASSCEHLISYGLREGQSFSENERLMIAYYLAEVSKLIDLQTEKA